MPNWCIWKTGLAGLVAAAAVVLAPPSGAQQRIVTNTASAQWMSEGLRFSATSNRVETAIGDPLPAVPAISTYRLFANGSGQPANIGPTLCHGTQGPQSLVPLGAFAGALNDPSITPTSNFRAGEVIVIGITQVAANRDPGVRDQMTVRLTLENGDVETIVLNEDSTDSGRFLGIINSIGVPPPVVAGDCRLSVDPGQSLPVAVSEVGNAALNATATLSFLVDPFGIVFDSGDGTPVPGTRITIVDADTGQPAPVFGDDGVSAFPSSVITGETVVDASGKVYNFPPGDYRFPFLAPGTYRLIVEPPAPFTAPSVAPPDQLAHFRRHDDDQPYTLAPASYGLPFALDSPEPLRVDIPIDQPGTPVTVRKTTSTQVAAPGDVVQYRITVANSDPRRTTGTVTVRDELPRGLRLRPGTVRVDGVVASPDMASDGRGFTLSMPPIAPAGQRLITYLAEITDRARPGAALNRASALDDRGAVSNIADATITIRRDVLGDRMTIIGRVTDGGCSVAPDQANGLANVRVMLQDGRYSVTDADGRYHFEGVHPGTHVVQIDPTSLPGNLEPVSCSTGTRTAGSNISRFVEGRGGALLRADFRARPGTSERPGRAAAPALPTAPTDQEAAGTERDWLAGQTAGTGWLFPEPDHNPRTKAVRVAIKHRPDQRVRLYVNGVEADNLLFEGKSVSGSGILAASVWRGVPIDDNANRLHAEVLDEDGSIAETLERVVHFAGAPVRATLVADQSILVADGVQRPRIAVRLTDRFGCPVRHGVTGAIDLPAPYRTAMAVAAQQDRQLSGLDRAAPVWQVQGDDGMAYIELEPTTTTGTLNLAFRFRDDQSERRQTIDLWLEPGDQPWTLVGFAQGTAGFNSLSARMEEIGDSIDTLNADARIALYAKGRIQGKWLMTLAYDSDKEKDDARFAGIIEPRAYYTIYADRTESRDDAASVRKLYLRLERPQFYALFGDFETGITEPQLTRYHRALNGCKTEYRGRNLAATAFVADTPFHHRRDEIQGNGLSGPYALSAQAIIPGTEQIRIETRDRLRSDQIINTRPMTRYVDYDIDYATGTLRFRAPVLSRDIDQNPQFIIADYELDGAGSSTLNAGARASWTSDDQRLRIGGTLVHDNDGARKVDMGGIDVRLRPGADSEIRAELALSRAAGAAVAEARTAHAWLVEAEHHDEKLDLLVYARRRGTDFGTGQLTVAQDGTRKVGGDLRFRPIEALSLSTSLWQEDFLATGARRRAMRAQGEFTTGTTRLRAGLIRADDWLTDGTSNDSTLAQLDVTQQLLNNRLEIDGSAEFALDSAASVDFPARYVAGMRFALTRSIRLIGAYEITDGDAIKARSARAGVELAPWTGARLVATANRQNIEEFGPRSFAAYGLQQSLQLSTRVSMDFTIDANHTLSGINPRDVLNPAHPVASGGFIGGGAGLLSEDFTALTLGASYRHDRLAATARAEYRRGDIANRYGMTLGVLRGLGEGRALGLLASWTRADGKAPVPTTENGVVELSWAHRPDGARIAWLNKAEARFDRVAGAVAGQPGPIGGPVLTVDGNASSRRVLNSLSVNWRPLSSNTSKSSLGTGKSWLESAEVLLFWGTRYQFDRFGPDTVSGWSNQFGVDARLTAMAKVDVGVSSNVRVGNGAKTVSWSGGPMIAYTPFDNANIILGYNFAGFHDRDFDAARSSRSGAYATFRLKFDQTNLARLGLIKTGS